MAVPPFIFFIIFFFFFNSPSFAALLAPITKDPSTDQYTMSIHLKTPLQKTKLLLNLGASFTWVDCTHYTSSSYHNIPCFSPLCRARNPHTCSGCSGKPGPGCANNSCSLFPENPLSGTAVVAQALVDSFALPTTDGRNPGPLAVMPRFVFSCSKTLLLRGLAKGAAGQAGLGRSELSVTAQASTSLSLPEVFALCLSGSPSAPGVGFFGSGGPYYFLPNIDLSKTLNYTPLLENPRQLSDEYFIGVRSIKVNGKEVDLRKSLLAVDENGFGGTTISTTTPYTVLETSIYKAFVRSFVKEATAINLTVTKPVKHFKVCYSADSVSNTRVGPGVPTVDLVMENDAAADDDDDDVMWRIFGSNSMVRIARRGVDVWCLGFLDGGLKPRASIVIGGHQIEDNLLQFDLGLKRLGFSSSVLDHGTMCANFNFTSNKARGQGH